MMEPTLDYQSSKRSSQWRIFHTRQGEDDVFAVRPLGFQTAGQGLGFVCIAALGIGFGCGGLWGAFDPGSTSSLPPPWDFFVSLAIGLLGLAAAAFAAYLAYSSTVLTMTRDTLRIVRHGPLFGSRTRAWPLERIRRFEVDTFPNNGETPEVYRLEILFRDGPRVCRLTGYGQGELTRLAQAMNHRLSQGPDQPPEPAQSL